MKIISDGTTTGTKLYTDDGEEIADVIEMIVRGTTEGKFIIVTVKLRKPKLDIEVFDKNIEYIIEE